jgi:predicted nucleotidyltransferase
LRPTAPLVRLLSSEQRDAIDLLVEGVLEGIRVELIQASLFGSTARGEARGDSDLDILLVFRWLPPDREPFATQAEKLAEEVAARTGVPVTVWSVALFDLEEGNRTPMLVDALEDSVPVWCRSHPLRPVAFTPADRVRCAEALLDRVCEGSEEFGAAWARGDFDTASRRARDDLVRLSSALLLLRGLTRPRRSDAIRTVSVSEFGRHGPPLFERPVFEWACESFGPEGRDEDRWVHPPPGGFAAVAATIDDLRERVTQLIVHLAPG